MVRLIERIDTLDASDAAVLITGETGTGKEIATSGVRSSPDGDIAVSPRVTACLGSGHFERRP